MRSGVWERRAHPWEGKEVGGGSPVFGGVGRKAAGKTQESEAYPCEVSFLLFA